MIPRLINYLDKEINGDSDHIAQMLSFRRPNVITNLENSSKMCESRQVFSYFVLSIFLSSPNFQGL